MAPSLTRSHRFTPQLAVASIVGALLLSACSGGDTTTDSASSSGPVDVSGSTITLFAPTVDAGDNDYQTIVDDYMAEFPDRKVEVSQIPNDAYGQSLRTQLQGGNAADVFYVTPGSGNPHSLLPLVEAGFVASLDGTNAESTVPDSNLQNFEKDGTIYGQALDLTVVSTVSNQSAQEADSFTTPADFAALLAACPAVADKDKSIYVLAGAAPPNTGLLGMLLSATRVYSTAPDWNQQRAAGTTTFAGTPGWVDTLNAVVQMNEAGCFQNGVEGGDFGAITQNLAQGKSYSAFIPAGGAQGLGQEAPDQTFVVDALPGTTAGQPIIFASANNALALNAASENADAAKAFLSWMAEPETLKTYSDLSGNLTAGKQIDTAALPPTYAPVVPLLDSGAFQPLPNQGWANGQVYDEFGKGIQGLLTGQATADQVLKSMDQAWDSGS